MEKYGWKPAQSFRKSWAGKKDQHPCCDLDRFNFVLKLSYICIMPLLMELVN